MNRAVFLGSKYIQTRLYPKFFNLTGNKVEIRVQYNLYIEQQITYYQLKSGSKIMRSKLETPNFTENVFLCENKEFSRIHYSIDNGVTCFKNNMENNIDQIILWDSEKNIFRNHCNMINSLINDADIIKTKVNFCCN